MYDVSAIGTTGAAAAIQRARDHAPGRRRQIDGAVVVDSSIVPEVRSGRNPGSAGNSQGHAVQLTVAASQRLRPVFAGVTCRVARRRRIQRQHSGHIAGARSRCARCPLPACGGTTRQENHTAHDQHESCRFFDSVHERWDGAERRVFTSARDCVCRSRAGAGVDLDAGALRMRSRDGQNAREIRLAVEEDGMVARLRGER